MGTDPIDYASCFAPFGLELETKITEGLTWENIGLEKIAEDKGGLYIESLRPATDAARAGLGDQMLIMKVDGKPYKDFDAKEFFEKFKKPKSLMLEVATEGGVSNIEVTWTGTWAPKTYTLAVSKKATAEQTALLESWLKSRQ
jgi:predicted metalloprotease with PDZ domain